MITYCTNIHPGESWEQVFEALRIHVPPIAAAVSPSDPFPVGLRLSHLASVELADDTALDAFSVWLEEAGCFVPTINGFPYGTFHGSRIKEHVYLPDWRSHERAEYTKVLADILVRLLPEGMTGSISTVPIAYGKALTGQEIASAEHHLGEVLSHLDRLRRTTGKKIILALEPEPGCFLESTADVCRFISSLRLPPALRELLGVCYDCCHQAVLFEDPVTSLSLLKRNDIPIAKVQVSAGLNVAGATSPLLKRFIEPCYLHQVVIRKDDGELARFDDLPDALHRHQPSLNEEWRVHFHIPLFFGGNEELGTTRPFIEELLPRIDRGALLEIETYTWDVLPAELRQGSVTDAIVREITWLKELSSETHGRP